MSGKTAYPSAAWPPAARCTITWSAGRNAPGSASCSKPARRAKCTITACWSATAPTPSTPTLRSRRFRTPARKGCWIPPGIPTTGRWSRRTARAWPRACSRSWRRWASPRCSPTRGRRFSRPWGSPTRSSSDASPVRRAGFRASGWTCSNRNRCGGTHWDIPARGGIGSRRCPTRANSTGAAGASATAGIPSSSRLCSSPPAPAPAAHMRNLPNRPMTKRAPIARCGDCCA